MKTSLMVLAALFSMSAFAGQFTAKVGETSCVEVDPFEVGDACVMNLKKSNGKKLALVFDFDDFQSDEWDAESLEGETVVVDADKIKRITHAGAVRELTDYNGKMPYYNAEVDAFEVMDNPMDALVSDYSGYFSPDRLPVGFKAKAVAKKDFEFERAFKSYLAKETKNKKDTWREFVMDPDGEYGHLSRGERVKIANDPKKELGTKYLLEITEIYKIYKRGKFVGYFMEISDHVQAALYQDGAWINLYLNPDQSVVKAFDESA